MTFVFGQDTTPTPTTTAATRADTRTLWLESFDGTARVTFDASPVKLLRGSLGLTKAPEEPLVSRANGLPGGYVSGVRVGVRRIMLPLQVQARSQAAAWAAVDQMRDLLDWRATGEVREGSCYLVGSSTSGIRRFTVSYVSGLEGEDNGVPNLDRFSLNLIAVDPYARDRDVTRVEFTVPDDGEPFLSDDPADTFDTRELASSAVFGQNMKIDVRSKIPVNPRVDFVGPFGPNLLIDTDTGMRLPVPLGIPAGSTLTAVTDPRGTSIRLDGAIAGGRIARPWTFGNPLKPGVNRMNVTATGATTASRVFVSWRGGWESLW